MGYDAAPLSVLPTFRLSSAEIGSVAALAAYQEIHREIFPCLQPAHTSPAEFQLDFTGWHLGRVMFGVIRSSTLEFERSADTIASSGMDHLLVQHYMEGGFAGLAGSREMVMREGDICVFDLTQTMRTTASDALLLTLMIPRQLFEAVMDNVGSLHGLVLNSNDKLTALLAAHLVALSQNVGGMESRAAVAAGQGTVAMITTILAALARHRQPRAMGSIPSQFRRVALYIDAHLGDAALSPATVAAAFGMSRASLYRLFESVDGISDYIRRRRLIAAALRLASPEHRARRVGQIALELGFTSEASFSRSFMRQFGISPREARERADRIWAADGWSADRGNPVHEFRVWMKTLQG